MLGRLTVENYALIDRLDIEFGPSLNIITGETGAGKSILLGALGLVMGNRADTAALQDNASNCVVEGVFNVSGHGLEALFEENDLEYDDVMTVRRIITTAGKSRAYVNDLPVQLTLLKEISAKLIDIHSQHQNLMLGDESFRTGIIDSVAGDSEALSAYREAYNALRSAERELARLREETERIRRDEEYLRFQYDQLAALRLREGELEELEAEQAELANAEQIQVSLAEAEQALNKEETGVLSMLKGAENALRHISGVYPRGGELSERLRVALVEVNDIGAELEREAGRVEADPDKLARVDERINDIYAQLRRHNMQTTDELVALEKDMAGKLELISDSGDALARAEVDVAALRKVAVAAAGKLTAARQSAAGKLGAEVGEILGRLGMPSCRFVCDIKPLAELSASGSDEVRFLFASNGSSTPQPLEKIASGGEVSRVMLALKSIVARNNMLPAIIFDEIDTGVSGRIADAMGEIIRELSGNMQVVNITHLPQVASKGDTHFVVYKDESAGRAKTLIRRLDPDERVEEIAKMLSGSQITEAALQQARTLLGN